MLAFGGPVPKQFTMPDIGGTGLIFPSRRKEGGRRTRLRLGCGTADLACGLPDGKIPAILFGAPLGPLPVCRGVFRGDFDQKGRVPSFSKLTWIVQGTAFIDNVWHTKSFL